MGLFPSKAGGERQGSKRKREDGGRVEKEGARERGRREREEGASSLPLRALVDVTMREQRTTVGTAEAEEEWKVIRQGG